MDTSSLAAEERAPRTAPWARILHHWVASERTPSVRYLHFDAHAVLARHDEGLADVGARVPVSRATSYHAFSITKPFTAVAVLQLRDRGLVDLDRAAAAYIPAFPYARTITVRHLLTHTAGIPAPVPMRWTHLEHEHAAFDEDRFFDALFARYSKLVSGPGERSRYSNLGYVLLGRLIANVSGLPYRTYLTEHVLAPAGIAERDLGFSGDATTLARGYQKGRTLEHLVLRFVMDRSRYLEPSASRWKPFRRYRMNGAAYGGLIGTPDGLMRFGQSLLAPRSSLLSEGARNELFAEYRLRNGRASGHALAWFTGHLNGHRYVDHAGGGGGYYAELRLYPDLGRGSVIMLNRTGVRHARLLDQVDAAVVTGR